MPRVIHFEIPADDPQRAVKFYETAFGWKINSWGGPMEYWLCSTGPESEPGIHGAIGRRDANMPNTTNTLAVPDVEEYKKKVVQAGGKVVSPQTMTIPGVGYFVYCLDTEGNLFGILQGDPAAK
jgi:predicted enzyme related to lactoylglutathione lyase